MHALVLYICIVLSTTSYTNISPVGDQTYSVLDAEVRTMSFENKVVLITGGSSGIGAATAVLFVKERASVAIVGRNEAKLKNVTEQCQEHGGTPLVIKADVSEDEAASDIIKQTIDKYGKLDVLVNNAGIVYPGGILDGGVLKTYDQIMNTNLKAVVSLTTLAAPHLIKTGGNVVNISSSLGTQPSPGMMAYGISKAGLEHFSKTAALELAPSGVRVNIVSPGPVVTDILKSGGIPHKWEDFSKQLPMRKVAYPNEVADLILFLASSKAKSITGGNYSIDNGYLLKNG